mmetsp:Transcript_17072/g.46826  ORF Transcript_17072/g.46826 Transcript_17072/m.46826 type:complete len:219 (-) Transcript_17072:163-819(-)
MPIDFNHKRITGPQCTTAGFVLVLSVLCGDLFLFRFLLGCRRNGGAPPTVLYWLSSFFVLFQIPSCFEQHIIVIQEKRRFGFFGVFERIVNSLLDDGCVFERIHGRIDIVVVVVVMVVVVIVMMMMVMIMPVMVMMMVMIVPLVVKIEQLNGAKIALLFTSSSSPIFFHIMVIVVLNFAVGVVLGGGCIVHGGSAANYLSWGRKEKCRGEKEGEEHAL